MVLILKKIAPKKRTKDREPGGQWTVREYNDSTWVRGETIFR